MDDRTLVELAAKAAGYRLQYRDGYFERFRDEAGAWEWWSPLTDDGDALRLAVKLNFGISINPEVDTVFVYPWKGTAAMGALASEPSEQDKCAATRRAIVRAAASIAQSMNQETPGRKSP